MEDKTANTRFELAKSFFLNNGFEKFPIYENGMPYRNAEFYYSKKIKEIGNERINLHIPFYFVPNMFFGMAGHLVLEYPHVEFIQHHVTISEFDKVLERCEKFIDTFAQKDVANLNDLV